MYKQGCIKQICSMAGRDIDAIKKLRAEAGYRPLHEGVRIIKPVYGVVDHRDRTMTLDEYEAKNKEEFGEEVKSTKKPQIIYNMGKTDTKEMMDIIDMYTVKSKKKTKNK